MSFTRSALHAAAVDATVSALESVRCVADAHLTGCPQHGIVGLPMLFALHMQCLSREQAVPVM